jgi:hypothetical protein
MNIAPELHLQIVVAIRLIQTVIQWKPGKDIAHLRTRKKWQHLAEDATLEEYQAIIQTVVHDEVALVYLYHFGSRVYPSIVAQVQQKPWLVMFGLDGIMETAFVIESPQEYLGQPEFELIGQLWEVLV